MTGDFRYPINLSLRDRPVLVVGAGQVAQGKINRLLESGASVTVVAPSAIESIAVSKQIRWFQRKYQRGEIASYRFAITATNAPDVNAQVAAEGEAANVLVNSADDPVNCSFTLPAQARSGDVQIAVSTNGRSPALASSLARELAAYIHRYDELLDVVAQVRTEAIAAYGTSESPKWRAALDEDLIDLIRAGRADEVARSLRHHLQLDRSIDQSSEVTR